MSWLGELIGGKKGTNAGNTFTGLNADSEKANRDYLNRSATAGGAEVMQDPYARGQFEGANKDIDAYNSDLGGARNEANDLASRGYQLTEGDKEAYGQASGDIARQFGQSQNSLASALSSRGLSASPGMSGAAFAGSEGNKNEQLAQLQTNIAQNRMKMNMDRLNQTRQFMTNLAGGRDSLRGNTMNSYQNAVNSRDALAQGKAGIGQGNLDAENKQNNANFNQTQATSSSGLGGAISRGIQGGVQSGIEGGLSTAINPSQMMGGNKGDSGGAGQGNVTNFAQKDNTGDFSSSVLKGSKLMAGGM